MTAIIYQNKHKNIIETAISWPTQSSIYKKIIIIMLERKQIDLVYLNLIKTNKIKLNWLN